jgi:hypothetical protein
VPSRPMLLAVFTFRGSGTGCQTGQNMVQACVSAEIDSLVTKEAIAAWRAAPCTTRGGQPHCSGLAIGTALTLRAVFQLA